jgi:protein gp37
MGGAWHHTYLILTKRAERLKAIHEINPLLKQEGRSPRGKIWDHVWLGVTVCNQAEADEKIPLLLQTPAAHRWISIEPMIGPVDLTKIDGGSLDPDAKGITLDALTGGCKSTTPWHLNAVILGGETGSGARPMSPDWVRTVRDQCHFAGVPFFFKGWGKHLPPLSDRLGRLYPSDLRPIDVLMSDFPRHLDGREHNDLPWR